MGGAPPPSRESATSATGGNLAPGSEGAELGCSKCRFSPSGCSRCRASPLSELSPASEGEGGDAEEHPSAPELSPLPEGGAAAQANNLSSPRLPRPRRPPELLAFSGGEQAPLAQEMLGQPAKPARSPQPRFRSGGLPQRPGYGTRNENILGGLSWSSLLHACLPARSAFGALAPEHRPAGVLGCCRHCRDRQFSPQRASNLLFSSKKL